jgi:hypothetical protein
LKKTPDRREFALAAAFAVPSGVTMSGDLQSRSE